MNVEPEQRAALLGEYIAEHSATVRAAARAFGCSKSTVHKDVSTRLRAVDAALFARVQAVLARNKAERHLRGGAATRRLLKPAMATTSMAAYPRVWNAGRGCAPVWWPAPWST